MPKLIFNTIHPAPYFDRLVKFLFENGWEVETWYFVEKTTEKDWKMYNPQNVHLYRELSTFERAKYFSKADFTILAWGNKENSLMGIYMRLLGAKFAYFLDHPDPCNSAISGLKGLLKRSLMSLATFIYPACYSCGDFIHDKFHISKDKIKVFPYPYSDAPDDINKINSNRQNELSNGAPPRLLICSRFILRKGYAVVYEAFKDLADKGLLDKFQIDIVGNGELFFKYRDKLLDLCQNINFYGWIENEEYERLLNNCDIYLHPSLFEPYGIPPLDAMIRSKYVIATTEVKSTDIFISEEGIALYAPLEAKSLSEILKFIITNPANIYKKTIGNPMVCKRYYSLFTNLKSINESISVR